MLLLLEKYFVSSAVRNIEGTQKIYPIPVHTRQLSQSIKRIKKTFSLIRKLCGSQRRSVRFQLQLMNNTELELDLYLNAQRKLVQHCDGFSSFLDLCNIDTYYFCITIGDKIGNTVGTGKKHSAEKETERPISARRCYISLPLKNSCRTSDKNYIKQTALCLVGHCAELKVEMSRSFQIRITTLSH